MIWIISIFIFLSASSYLIAYHLRNSFWVYTFKPGTILLMILMVSFGTEELTHESTWIIIGLIFSLSGDIFLMIPKNKFLEGLVSFLIAHLCYIIAFTQGLTNLSFEWNVGIPFFAVGILYYAYLLKSLKQEKNIVLQVGVFVYIVVICFMGVYSFSTGSQLAIIGSIIFLLSDAILALNKFAKPFQTAQYYVMITYYAAQYLISLSVLA
ncbi:lysoplasmalogenase [Bacillus sp. 2205SS5-2]|uniref:lysoplasmalogenase n=1 Tax=Bacillus sp. 2205SS5-2 TaxID=3109031 RepID=UPI0030064C58